MTTSDLGPQKPLSDDDLLQIGRGVQEFQAQKKDAEDQQLVNVFQAAMHENPELAAERDRLVGVLKLENPQAAPTDIDVLRRVAKEREVRDVTATFSPMVREQLKEQRIARLVQDDLGNLKVAGDTFGWFSRAIEAGAGQNELSNLLAKQALSREAGDSLTPAELDRIAELRLIQQWTATDNGWLDATVRTAAQIVGPMLESTAAGGVAAGAASLGGPIAAGTAFTVGAVADIFARSAYQEFGSQYDQTYQKLTDAGIAPEMAHAIALKTAAAYGIGAGAVEAGAHMLVLKPFVGAAKALGGRLAGKVLAEQGLTKITAQAAARTFLRETLHGVGGESLEEGIQQALSSAADNIAASLAGKPELGTSLDQTLTDIGDAMYQTAKGMALIAPLGPALHYWAEQKHVTEAKTGAQFLKRLGENMAELKLVTRSPDDAANLVDALGAEHNVDSVYVPAEKLAQALEATGHTREQLAKDAPLVAERLAQAEKTGDDVAIPIGDYATKIATTTLGPALEKSVRVNKDGFSLDQAEQWLAEKDANQKALEAKTAELSASITDWNEQARRVEQRIAGEIAGASDKLLPGQTALLASLHRRFVETQAADLGVGPEQFDAEHRLTVKRGASPDAQVYSQEGKLVTDTPEFRAWFQQSKVVDESGSPRVVYHGTARPDRIGNRFRKSRATSGPMAFFTDSAELASGYANNKSDTSLEHPDDYSGWFRYKPHGSRSSTVDVARAWHFLSAEERQRIAQLAPRVTQTDNGDIILGDESRKSGLGGYDQHLKEARGNHLKALVEEWLNSAALFDDEASFLDVLRLAGVQSDIRFESPHQQNAGVFPVYLSIQNPLDTRAIPPEVVTALEKASRRQRAPNSFAASDFWDKRRRDPREWISDLQEGVTKGGDSHAWTSIPDWVTRTLQSLGYDGVRDYSGKNQETDRNETAVWIPFEESQVKSVNNRGTWSRNSKNMLRQIDDSHRGSFDPSTNTIFLHETHDATTLLHEFSHFWLTSLFWLASQPEAGPTFRRRAQVVLDWFGVKDLDAWNVMPLAEQRKHHEAWAYRAESDWFGTGEGAALTMEQSKAMRSFGRWVRAAYRDAKGRLNEVYRRNFNSDLPALTPEVRMVFDRMVASEDAIEAAKVQQDWRPLFTLDARPLGVTDEDWTAYQLAAQDGSDLATEQLQRKALQTVKWLRDSSGKTMRKFQAAARAARKAVESEERVRLENEPIRIAEQRLRHGTIDDNGNVMPFKLSLREFRGTPLGTEDNVAKLGTKPDGMLAENGLPLDPAAQMLGFRTGRELTEQLLALKPFDEELADRTDAKMQAEHSLLADPEKMKLAVDSALHNEARMRIVAAELRWLAKVSTPTQVMVRAARSVARDQIGRTRVGDVHPHEFAQKEARARRDAEKALVKGDHPAAVVAKRRELLAAQSEREAITVREEIDALTELLRKLFKSDEKLGKARDVDYLAIGRALAADLGLAPGEKTGGDYIAQLQAHDPALFDRLSPILDRVKEWAAAGLEAGRVVKDWRDLTVDEFRDLHETIGALWQQSRRVQQVVIGEQRMELDAAANELAVQEAKLPAPKARDPKSLRAKVGRLLHLANRPEHWAFRLDGAEQPGAFTNLVWRLVRDAVDKFHTSRNRYTKRMVDLVQNLHPKLRQGLIEFRDRDGNLLHVFGNDNGGFGHAELVAALLHTGNEGNFRRLILGRKWGKADEETGALDASNWNRFVRDMVDKRFITKEVMDFVQATWDLVEELKPGAQATHKDLYGFRFEEVEATPLAFPFGNYRGGYMPAKLDKSAASAMRVQSLADIEQDARQQFASTGRGFTKRRVEKFAEPLLLDLRLVPSHIDDVLRFTHLQPAVRDVEKMLKHEQVAPRLEARQPGVWNSLVLPWLQHVASQSTSKRGRSEDIDNFWRATRTSVGVSTMFANLPNAVQQLTGIIPAALKVKPRYLFRGLWRWLRERGGLNAEIAQLSPFMANRQHNQTAESHEALLSMTQNRTKLAKARAWVSRHGYFLQEAFQNATDSVIWTGAYEQAMESMGRDVTDADAQTEAVKQADAAVRMTQGSFDPTDVAHFEEGTPFYKLWTMFAGFFNTQANLQADQFTRMAQRQGFAKAGPAFAAYMLGFAVPMLLADAVTRTMRGQWDDKDKDGDVDVLTADFLFLGQLRSLAAEIPVAGPALVAPVVNMFDNQPWNDRMTTSPAVSLLERTFGTVATVTKKELGLAADRDGTVIEGKEVRDALTLLGVMFGLPAGAVAARLGYARNVQIGKVRPQGAGEVVRALLGGSLK